MKYLYLICWLLYWSTAIAIGITYAIRGQNWYRIEKGEKVKKGEIAHQFLYHFLAALSGFGAWAAAYKIFNSFQIKSLSNISIGSSVLLIFLYIWGTVGVSGWLTDIIANVKDILYRILDGLIKKSNDVTEEQSN